MIKFACILIVLCIVQLSHQYFITVDPNSEECFYEKGLAGTRYALIFEVLEGSYLDIDLRVSWLDLFKALH